jgi:hypothetical protein
MVSHGSGTAGGIFAPLLVLGAEIGRFVGKAGHHLFLGIVHHAATFAVVGMAAYFSAIVRAPLTASCRSSRSSSVISYGVELHPPSKNLLLDPTVLPGSPFDGKAGREVGLPPGCIPFR